MIQLYNDDCFIQMDKMIEDGIKVDAIITDPPYIISKASGFAGESPTNSDYTKKYGKHNIDFGDWDNIPLDVDSLFNKFYKLLNDGGTVLFFYDVWKMQDVKEIAEKYKFKQPRLCCWTKTNPVPINSKLNYLSNVKEYFCTFVKKSKPTFNSKYDNGSYSYPICHGKERTKHPTQKPLKLMEELITKHTNEGQVVLDPFMGSGTTGEACRKLKRNFIGIEQSEEYFKIVEDRLLKEENIDDDEW